MSDRYLVATGNYSSTSTWSATDGGSSGASVPTAADDIHITAASGSSVLTVDTGATRACRSIDASAANGATVTGTGALSVGTSTAGPSNIWIKLPATGLTWSYTGTLSFVGTNATAQEFTSGGSTFAAFTISGAAGTVKLMDNLTSTGILTLTNGTIDINGKTVNTLSVTITSNSNTRVFAMGAGSVSLSSTGTAWSQGATLTNFSITGTGTVTLSGTASTLASAGATLTGSSVTFAMTGSGTQVLTGAGTFYNLTRTGTASNASALTLSANVTVNNTFTATGNNSSPNRVTIKSDTPGTSRTITAAVASLTNVSFLDITGAGAATWSGTSVATQANTTSNITGSFNAGRYAVAPGNWSSTATWSNEPGGTAGAVIPTANDDVFFAVGAAGGTYTVDTGSTPARSLDFTGCSGITFAGVASMSIGAVTRGQGDIAINTPASGLTWTHTGIITFVSTASTAQTFTSNGVTHTQQFIQSGAGSTIRFADTFLTTSTVTLTNGTFDINGQTWTASVLAVTSNSNTRVFAMGTSASVALTSTASAWSQGATLTGFSMTGTGTVTCSGAGCTITPSSANLSGASITFQATGSGNVTLGAGTFYNFTRTTAANNDTLSLSGDVTVSNLLTLTGTSLLIRLFVQSSVVGTPRTITAASVALTNTTFQDITGAGVASPFTGTSLGNALGNSGITFTTVSRYWVGGTGNWSDTTHWSATDNGPSGASVPLAQDAVFITSNSGGGLITMDRVRACASLDCTGTSSQLTYQSQTPFMYGSLTLGIGQPSTASTSSVLTLAGRGSLTITSNGVIIQGGLTVNGIGGTYTLQDNLSNSQTFTVTSGTFTANGFNVSCAVFSSTGSTTRTLNMGSGIWSLTSATNGATVWNVASSGFTLNASTSIIDITATGGGAKTFTGAGLTYGTLRWVVGTGTLTLGGSTFNNLIIYGGRSVLVTAGTTTTITGSLALNNGYLILSSTAGGSSATISAAPGVNIVMENLSVQDMTGSGGATFNVVNSKSVSNNSGLTFVTRHRGFQIPEQ